MTKLEEMWAALERYQPCADADGHGVAWSAMCKLKTSDSAEAASRAALKAAGGDFWAFYLEAKAANMAGQAASVIGIEEHAQEAIDRINGVIRLKESSNE